MPKFIVKLRGLDPFPIQANFVAYEGPAVILYDEFPYQPKRVIMNWECQVWMSEE